MTSTEQWQTAQEHERKWWSLCTNTFGEEVKQLLYAEKMGLEIYDDGNSPFNIRADGKKILDIGGGPVSMLLKCDRVRGTVVDPCDYPAWVKDRYIVAGIEYIKQPAENSDIYLGREYDEAWIYNCLQHTVDPEKIIANAKKVAKTIRIFEWIDHPVNAMHPQMLTEEKLNEWLGGSGKTEILNTRDLQGKCFYGVF